jgi:hypothetical protein
MDMTKPGPKPRVTPEVIAEAVRKHGSQRKAAAALGMSQANVNYQLSKIKMSGVWELPDGHRVRGVSSLVDPAGEIRGQWLKTERVGVLSPEEIVKVLQDGFRGWKPPARKTQAPKHLSRDHLTLYPCADWHLGLYCWEGETETNWDLKIAQDVIGNGFDELVERSPDSETAIVLGGGDLLHADNELNRTSRSGAPLDVDGRFPKVLLAASHLMVRAVDAALRKHKNVVVRILKGNHDDHAAVAVSYFLLAWYRHESRVVVDVDQSLFWWFRFGKVFLGATHGHTVKMQHMAGIMAHRRAEDWGRSKFRYVHGFHLHHSSKVASEGNGVVAEIWQTPAPQDAWHFGKGYLSGRSLNSVTYHKDLGEVGRVRTAIIDG